jgi:hypothetical protein
MAPGRVLLRRTRSPLAMVAPLSLRTGHRCSLPYPLECRGQTEQSTATCRLAAALAMRMRVFRRLFLRRLLLRLRHRPHSSLVRATATVNIGSVDNDSTSHSRLRHGQSRRCSAQRRHPASA